MIKVDFSLNQKISSQLAFIFVLLLSFVVALVTVSKAREVIDESKNSPAFNIQKRVQAEIPNQDGTKPKGN